MMCFSFSPVERARKREGELERKRECTRKELLLTLPSWYDVHMATGCFQVYFCREPQSVAVKLGQTLNL